MAIEIQRYHKHRLNNLTGIVPMTDGETYKLALLSDSYTPDLENDEVWADASTYEVASGDGYTTGGEALSDVSITIDSDGVVTFDASDVEWTSLTKTWKYGIIYQVGSYGTSPYTVNPLFCLIDFDNSATDATVSVTALDYWVVWSASGIFQYGTKGDV